MDLASLWTACKSGDAAARCTLIEHYAGLPGRLARRLHPAGVTAVGPEDLESAGMLGLIDAVDRYQPGREVPFEAYATLRIRGAILDELRSATGGRRAERPAHVSLDELLLGGDHILPAEDERGATSAAEELAARLESALRYLGPREREVLSRYYGQDLTLRETGAKMGISEARACQLHGRAIAALRQRLAPQRFGIAASAA